MTLKELSQLYYLEREIAKLEQEILEAETPGKLLKKKDALLRRCRQEKLRLETYIAGIEDSQTRLIFRLRFVDQLDWNGVADEVGGGNTEDSVKKACYRYLKRNP